MKRDRERDNLIPHNGCNQQVLKANWEHAGKTESVSLNDDGQVLTRIQEVGLGPSDRKRKAHCRLCVRGSEPEEGGCGGRGLGGKDEGVKMNKVET